LVILSKPGLKATDAATVHDGPAVRFVTVRLKKFFRITGIEVPMSQMISPPKTCEARLVSVGSSDECAPQQYPHFHELGLELSD
jgi:hypothetical protein